MRRGALNHSCSDTSQSFFFFFFFTSHNYNCGELHVDADDVAGVPLTHSTTTTIAKVDLQDRLKPLLLKLLPGGRRSWSSYHITCNVVIFDSVFEP